MTGTTAMWGRRLALAAIVVQVPRLVLMALAADHLRLPAAWEGLFVGISGVGAALALTGGNVYLAHVLALTRRWLLAVPWLLVLACTAVLLTPMQVAGLERRHLESVLSTPELRWFWNAVNVLAGELVAAACMLAALVAEQAHHAAEQAGRELPAAQLPPSSSSQLIQLGLAQIHHPPSAPVASPVPVVACRHGCGWKGSVMGERGHQRTCPRREVQSSVPNKPLEAS